MPSEAAALEDDGWQPVIDPIVKPIRKLLRASASYEEFQAGLAELVSEMKTDKLVRLLGRAAFAARLAGETEAPLTEDE